LERKKVVEKEVFIFVKEYFIISSERPDLKILFFKRSKTKEKLFPDSLLQEIFL
jgi:hypothetical protein